MLNGGHKGSGSAAESSQRLRGSIDSLRLRAKEISEEAGSSEAKARDA